ncbi:MAG: hypothetical protein J6N92_02260 [Alloprevotella sp.]|nr:hypothetical protein [Alloprevotella sp.]
MSQHIKHLTQLVALFLLLTACSTEEVDVGRMHEVSLTVLSEEYHPYDVGSALKALPAGFALFNPAVSTTIDAFMPSAGQSPTEGAFTYDGSCWTSNILAEEGRTYQLYGMMPKSQLMPVSYAPFGGNYANGAVLTLTNVLPVSMTDVCVITGVKQGDKEHDSFSLLSDVRLGTFEFVGQSAKTGNTLFLLFNHILASVTLRMRIVPTSMSDYSLLRTIKLRSMSLQSAAGQALSATVTVQRNETGAMPITDISWTTTTAGTSECLTFESTEGLALTTDYQDISTAYFAPNLDDVLLVTTYDVYDKEGNLLRENQRSENKLTQLNALNYGQRTTLFLTVNPSYLYVLSNEDLDNPTLTID